MIYRISELEKNNNILFTDDVKIASLQHLYIRFILNIGDSGTHNILLRMDKSKKIIVGNDFDEISNNNNNTILNCLWKLKPSKLQVNIYTDFTKYITRFNKLSDSLIELLKYYDMNYIDINNRINLFNSFFN